ncbi:MAG: hypothetical protein OQK94_02310 [Gammaproteobacteria bacterium]|nr:hypothetical protein [Gammaproteobacteria bacterium]MCW8840251.1 hypothetical protein [Gammaproteobacteria bacterium]MCW8959821.1 hypothetical protein [Gammaproteobacteria bacterium]MCW8971882.1 hypothetical protein [Gammaproteobacteria bacterium]MCW8994012.1 hypothetical protein [Gammaproteobacteria bacterium]
MNDKRYQVIYTGRLKPGLDADTVKSNLVLLLGIDEVKAAKLLQSGPLLLKRCNSAVEAQVLAEKFEQAGILCGVHNGVAGSDSNPGVEAGGESSLVRMLRHVSPSSGSDSPSLFKRLIGGDRKHRRA